MKKNSLSVLQLLGSLLVLTGAVLKFVRFDFAGYIFAGGAVLLFIVHLIYLSKSKNEDLQTQRAHRLMVFATLLLGAAAYFMIVGGVSWIPFVLAYAVVSLYLSYRSR